MLKRVSVYLQYLLPQHLISIFVGRLANSRISWFKNFLIKNFIALFSVNLDEAVEKNPEAYASFNDFFIRKIHLEKRNIPFADDIIISPADGAIAQVGVIKRSTLITAKDFYFDLESLLAGDDELTRTFDGGAFTTIYLAPPDYHRVHMPCSGKLIKTIFVPGKLFSVNRMTTSLIPNIYSRNERFISIFDTDHGKVALIMVGALIVGSIKVNWLDNPVRAKCLTQGDATCELKQGDEVGYFMMGSTVILLSEPGRIQFHAIADQKVKIGQIIGKFNPS